MNRLRCKFLGSIGGLIVLLASAHAHADTPRLIAVLPLAGTQLDAESRTIMEETIRSVAGEILKKGGWTVLGAENTLAVLADNGIDAAKVCEAACAVEAARELKAEYLVSGTVSKLDDGFVMLVRLSESRTGSQLGSVDVEAPRVSEVRRAFKEKADALFAKVLEQRPVADAALKAAPSQAAASSPNWLLLAGAVVAIGAGVALDNVPATASNNKPDGLDLVPPALYLGGALLAWGGL